MFWLCFAIIIIPLCSSSIVFFTVSSSSSKNILTISYSDLTAPPNESTLACYLSTNRPFVMDPELDLETLLESYVCKSKCLITTKNLRWRCLALSSVSELHNGYMTYNAGLDYVISHARNIAFGNFLSFLALICNLHFSFLSCPFIYNVTWCYFI